MSEALDPDVFDVKAFQKASNVSRETLDRLTLYADLLVKWQKSINLVAPSTIPQLWHRHMLDSAQLALMIKRAGFDDPVCVDMGTGAGFPGLVLAIMGVGRWTLVDSDQKKAVFLREVARVTGVSVTIVPMRLEGVMETEWAGQADVVTARACAPLSALLGYAAPLMHDRSRALFLKGRGAADELETARADWSFEANMQPSVTDPKAQIIAISGPLERRS